MGLKIDFCLVCEVQFVKYSLWKISDDCPFVSVAHKGVGLLFVPLAAKPAALLFPFDHR